MRREENKQLSHVVTVNYDTKHGIRLGWNFQGVSNMDTTHYHLLIFMTPNLNFTQKMLLQFYKQMKIGDILGVYNQKNMEKRNKSFNWIQKTRIFQNPEGFISGIEICQNSVAIEKIIDNIFDVLKSKSRGLYFLNFVFFSKGSKQLLLNEEFEKLISKRRQENYAQNKIVNILYWGDPHNNPIINGSLGLNYFPLNPQSYTGGLSQLKKFQKSCCYLKVTITLHFSNSVVTSKNQNIWKNIGFQTIQRSYYGIPTISFSQDLFLIDTSNSKSLDIQFTIKLNYTDVDGDQYKVQKKHHIENDTAPFYTSTYHAVQNEIIDSVQLWKNQEVYTNLVNKNYSFSLQVMRQK